MSKEMLSKIDYKQNRLLIDWFSFSSRIDNFESFVDLLGMSSCNWEVKSGVCGYQYRYYFEGISIHTAGDYSFRFVGTNRQEQIKGAWLEMSGSGCRAFETYGNGNWQKLINYFVSNFENVTANRIDIAYDDFLGYLDIVKIAEDTEKHNFISKFRSNPEIIKSIGVDETAITVTHGRMSSDTFIRIYDKRLEQNAQDFTNHWIRNEIMLRHDRAFVAISLLSDDKKPLSEVYFLIMNNYLRYITPSDTDSNQWRAPMAAHWQKFAESVTTYRVSLWSRDGVDYNQLRLTNFVEKMAGAAIFTYVSIFGVDKLIDECNKKSALLAPKYKILLDSLDSSND